MRISHHLIAAGLAVQAQAILTTSADEVTGSPSLESRLTQIANGEGEVSNDDLQALVQLRGELEAETASTAESMLEAMKISPEKSGKGSVKDVKAAATASKIDKKLKEAKEKMKTKAQGKAVKGTKKVAKVGKGGKKAGKTVAKVGKKAGKVKTKSVKATKGKNKKTVKGAKKGGFGAKKAALKAKIAKDKAKTKKITDAKKAAIAKVAAKKDVKGGKDSASATKADKTIKVAEKKAALKTKIAAKKIATAAKKPAKKPTKKVAPKKAVSPSTSSSSSSSSAKVAKVKKDASKAIKKQKEAAKKMLANAKKTAKKVTQKAKQAATGGVVVDKSGAPVKQMTPQDETAVCGKINQDACQLALERKQKEAQEKERSAAQELFKAKQQASSASKGASSSDPEEKALMLEMDKKLDFINDIVSRNKMQGVELNMMDGLASDMIEMAKAGKSPICAVEKRLANGKMMAWNLARQFDLVPAGMDINAFMNDTNDWWTQQFTASPTTAAQTESQGEVLLDTLGLPIIC